MHVEFFGLGLVLRSSGKQLLRNVTGKVRHARLTAVMGPSGSGAQPGSSRVAYEALRILPHALQAALTHRVQATGHSVPPCVWQTRMRLASCTALNSGGVGGLSLSCTLHGKGPG